MKKIILPFLTAVFMLLLLSACSSKGADSNSDNSSSDGISESSESGMFGRIEDEPNSDTFDGGEADYKAACQQFDYKQISRYPSEYEGKDVYFQGHVQQVLEDGNDVTLLVNTSMTDLVWDDTIIVWYTRQDNNEARILEGDIVDLWGELEGLYTYESLLGESITVPSMKARYAVYLESYDEGNSAALSSNQSSVVENTIKSEEELLAEIESASGYTVEDYLYVDMDNDGAGEIVAGYLNPDTLLLEFWYCSSTGSECYNLDIDSGGLPYFSFDYLPYDTETHIIINTIPESGFGYFSILSKEGDTIRLLCHKRNGNAYQVGTDIQVVVDNFDSYYDPDMAFLTGHAYEETYIHYDGEAYHEYPAIELSEAEFYSYQDAGLYPGIGFTPPSELDMLKFYKRDNDYLYIQFGVKNTETGEIHYFYYVYQLVDNRVVPVDGITNQADGQIQMYLTNLD